MDTTSELRFEYMFKRLIKQMEFDRWLVDERAKADEKIIKMFGNDAAREVLRMRYGYE